jgi:riboflavin-specific deaminase-like protein
MKVNVVVSFAQSIDGCLATMLGESKWISNNKTIELSQQLRRDIDAILVGVGTVIKDNPQLTYRLIKEMNPLRIILDPSLQSPLTSHVFQDQANAPSIFFHSPNTYPTPLQKDSGAQFYALPTKNSGEIQHLDLVELIKALALLGISSVYVEGGARIITSFLQHNLVDELIIVTSPIIIGNGIKAIGDIGVRKLNEALKPKKTQVQVYEGDVVWRMNMS